MGVEVHLEVVVELEEEDSWRKEEVGEAVAKSLMIVEKRTKRMVHQGGVEEELGMYYSLAGKKVIFESN